MEQTVGSWVQLEAGGVGRWMDRSSSGLSPAQCEAVGAGASQASCASVSLTDSLSESLNEQVWSGGPRMCISDAVQVVQEPLVPVRGLLCRPLCSKELEKLLFLKITDLESVFYPVSDDATS